VAQFAQAVMPMVAQNHMPASISSAILQAALKPYAKHDRNLEEAMLELPETQAQLGQMNETIKKGTQENETLTQQMQYWQQLATLLKDESTKAKSEKEMADARLKAAQEELARAKAAEIRGETKDGALQPLKTVAEIAEISARADSTSDNSNQMFQGG
jgi:hypothetical protein